MFKELKEWVKEVWWKCHQIEIVNKWEKLLKNKMEILDLKYTVIQTKILLVDFLLNWQEKKISEPKDSRTLLKSQHFCNGSTKRRQSKGRKNIQRNNGCNFQMWRKL